MNTFIHHEGSTYIQYSKIKKRKRKKEWVARQCEGRTERRADCLQHSCGL